MSIAERRAEVNAVDSTNASQALGGFFAGTERLARAEHAVREQILQPSKSEEDAKHTLAETDTRVPFLKREEFIRGVAAVCENVREEGSS